MPAAGRIEALKDALFLNPRSAETWVLLAEEYLGMKDISSALAALESAAGISPENPVPYLKAARIMRFLNRKNEWLHLLEKAHSLHGKPTASRCPNPPSVQPETIRPPARKPTSGKKRVLFMAGEKSMIFHDCREGFETLGWETGQELFGDFSHQEPDAHERLALRIRSFRPHLVVSINQAGCDRGCYILSALKEAGIPVFIWYVDNPFALLPEDNPSMVSEAAVLGSFDSSYVKTLKERTGVDAIHLPLGTNPKRFQPAGVSAPDDWNISFVGNLGVEKAARRREAMIRDDPSILQWIDRAVDILSGSPFPSACDALEKSARGPGWDGLPRRFREKVFRFAETEASAKRRLEIVTRLKEERIRVVGDEEWRRYVNSGCWIPPVDYLTGLCGVYRRSRIVLNISRYQLRSGVTQRVFDVPAAGGFLISDRTEELERYLLPHKEVVLYEDIAELKDKIAYYLPRERERRDMAMKARRRVLREHTYVHRINKIISAFGLN